MDTSNNTNCASGCNETHYLEKNLYVSSAVWKYLEEKVSHKFEVKLKLTMNDVNGL